jgi:hypothetical protein
MICGLLTIALPTVILTVTKGFSAAVSLAPEMGVVAMAVSFAVVPLVSIFTKKFDSTHIEKVFNTKREID